MGAPVIRTEIVADASMMDRLIENAQRYSDILKRCSLPEIANWKVEDIERAFHWADYFKNVHRRTAQRQSLMHKLDVQLKKMGHQFGWRFAGEELCFKFLACSAEYLTKALLENPALPAHLKEKVLQHSDNALHKHLEDVSTSQTLLATFSAMHDKLAECVKTEEQKISFTGLKHTNVLCLHDDIKWQLTHPTEQPGSLLEKRLNDFAQQDGGMEIILLVLLYSPAADKETVPHEGDGPGASVNPVKNAVLEWLMKEIRNVTVTRSAAQEPSQLTKVLWNQDPTLLGRVSSQHLTFFKEHIKYLVHEVESLQAENSTSVNSIAAQEVKYRWIRSHFLALALSEDSVRDVCISLVKSRVSPEMQSTFGASLGAHLMDVWSKLYSDITASCKLY